jgi:hypothetical protein
VLVLGGAGVLAAAFLVGATMAWSPYIESSVNPESNPRAWAALQPVYAESGSCVECHEPETTKAATARHAGIACESCHGALLGHVESSRGTYMPSREVVAPTDEVCLRCHTRRSGDPGSPDHGPRLRVLQCQTRTRGSPAGHQRSSIP